MSLRRLNLELQKSSVDPLPNCSAGPVDDNLYLWHGTIVGPMGSPYENGLFHLRIVIPPDYPFMAPKITFITKIYHPNVSPSGAICLDILKDRWSPALTIHKVLLSISSLLTDANPDDPLNIDAAQLYKANIYQFNLMALEWTKKYGGI